MSDANAPAPLQFEKAEFTTPQAAPTCAVCSNSVGEQYFEANQQIVCTGCRDKLLASQGRNAGAGGWLKALLFGGGAAILGAIVWFAIRKITGYEIGLISVGIGVAVGRAVRHGAGGAGGVKLQLLAVALTYAGITLNYVPDVIQDFVEGARKELKAKDAAKNGTASAAPITPPGEESPAAPASPPTPPKDAGNTSPLLGLLMFLGIVVGISLASPFLAADPLGWLILGFGMWEAWKVNRALDIQFAGPFRVAPAATEPAPAAQVASGG